MSVQNTGECIFSLAAEKTFNQFLEFYPQVKYLFLFFFLIFLLSQFVFSIFQEKEKTKTGLLLFLCPPKMARRPTAHARAALSRALPRAQAATWAWAGKVAWRAHPPGLKAGPFFHHRQISSDGFTVRSGRSKRATGTLPRKP